MPPPPRLPSLCPGTCPAVKLLWSVPSYQRRPYQGESKTEVNESQADVSWSRRPRNQGGGGGLGGKDGHGTRGDGGGTGGTGGGGGGDATTPASTTCPAPAKIGTSIPALASDGLRVAIRDSSTFSAVPKVLVVTASVTPKTPSTACACAFLSLGAEAADGSCAQQGGQATVRLGSKQSSGGLPHAPGSPSTSYAVVATTNKSVKPTTLNVYSCS